MWKCKICHFYTFTGSDFWFFMNFCNLWRLKRTKSKKSKALKMAKTAVLELLDSPKLISRKISMTKILNFHTVYVVTTLYWVMEVLFIEMICNDKSASQSMSRLSHSCRTWSGNLMVFIYKWHQKNGGLMQILVQGQFSSFKD